MLLYIDTTDFNSVTFAVSDGKKTRKKVYKISPHESHKTIQKLEQFFNGLKIKDSRFKKIIVNRGPGSYTGTRIGVTMAQALGFSWKIPVKFAAKDKFTIK
jgi:tRNA threonylcarbamoyladenosine biosynthesis protein TsaB